MNLQSTAFAPSQQIPERYTCLGENISPPLLVSGVPEKTRTLALIMHDPDAPAGDWVHWVVWNLPPDVSEIIENEIPKGAREGTTDFDESGYGGPCPPRGTHRYIFTLYALDAVLDLPAGARRTDLEQAMHRHIIAQAELIGLATAR